MSELIKEAIKEINHSYATIVDSELVYQRSAMLNMFRKGTEWQSMQSPWISVKERLPIPVIEAIDGNEYGSIDVLGAIQNSYGDYDYYICRYWGYNKEYRWENGIAPDYWMPIPKFSE